MPDSGKHESEDLADYEVLDGSDTLDGARATIRWTGGSSRPTAGPLACSTR